MQGYQSLRERAAWLDLSARAKIVIAGEDRARWLHGISTNHVEQLAPGEGLYCFFLDTRGHILADACLFALHDRVLLDTEAELREPLLQHLDKYILADDVTLEDATGRLSTLAVEGPVAETVLRAAGAPAPVSDYAHAPWGESGVARASCTGAPGFRIFVPETLKQEVIGRLEAAGAAPTDAEAARVIRLEHGKPRYGDDITDANLPQETQQLHAIHFSKGCYLGQEIVERIRSRGHVNRVLVSLRIEGKPVPEAGTRLSAGGTEAGHITSAAFSPALEKVVALAYVRAQFAEPKTRLMAGDLEAQVV